LIVLEARNSKASISRVMQWDLGKILPGFWRQPATLCVPLFIHAPCQHLLLPSHHHLLCCVSSHEAVLSVFISSSYKAISHIGLRDLPTPVWPYFQRSLHPDILEFRMSTYLLGTQNSTHNNHIPLRHHVLLINLYTVSFSLLLLAFDYFPTDMWCYAMQREGKMSNSPIFKPRENKQMLSPSPLQTVWEQETIARTPPLNSSKLAALRALPILSAFWIALAKLALAGAQRYSHPHQDEPWSELFIYQFLIELMFTHDCEQMINLL
jgi:hypothetical protein